MMKMTGHMGVGIIVFLLFGFAIKQFAWPLAAMPNGWRLPWEFIADGGQSIAFYVSLMFALVSCAIPSGCFSGRMKFSAYLVFAALYVGVIYPGFAYLLWNGPLARLGVQDYAGSLGVHAVGGIVGIVGAKFLGRRRTPTTDGRNNHQRQNQNPEGIEITRLANIVVIVRHVLLRFEKAEHAAKQPKDRERAAIISVDTGIRGVGDNFNCVSQCDPQRDQCDH